MHFRFFNSFFYSEVQLLLTSVGTLVVIIC